MGVVVFAKVQGQVKSEGLWPQYSKGIIHMDFSDQRGTGSLQ